MCPSIAPLLTDVKDGPPGASSRKFTVSSKWSVLKELEGQKNIGNMSAIGHMRSHHTSYIQWSPAQRIVFWLDMASCPLWEREGFLAYRKKSAHCSWRAMPVEGHVCEFPL